MLQLQKKAQQLIKHIAIILAFLLMLSSPVAAQDFDKGLAAAQAGDYATALQEWTPLAESGNVIAQYNLGIMYDSGQGVIQDYKEAAKWYKLAAEQGYANAQLNLGRMYNYGEGVIRDYKEAVKWYRFAAERGNANAQHNLGILYYNGQGVIEDYKEAINFAQSIKLDLNAGHDLSLLNLENFLNLGKIHEVSIGHSLVSESLIYGVQETINQYINIIGN